MRLRAVLSCVLLVALAFAARAQSVNDRFASQALRASHLGALTPLMTPSMIRRTVSGAQLGIRYGLMDEQGQRTHAIAGSGILAVGLASSVTLTAGVTDSECSGCAPGLILGLGGDMRVFERADVVASGSTFTIAVGGDFGYAAQASNTDQSALALGIGAPMTLVFGGNREGMRIVPYFAPVFGVGQVNDVICIADPCDKSPSGTRVVLGGGLGIWNPISSISASVGVNQVMINSARPVFGVNVIVGGR